jgi:hypothetical protein
MAAFKWTEKRRQAARMMGDGKTWREIQEAVGISEYGLASWNRRPEFRSYVEKIKAACLERAKDLAVAQVGRRIELQQDIVNRLVATMEERGATAPSDVPGAKTGLLARDFKQVGKDTIKEVWRVDRALLQELREYQELVARELQQRCKERIGGDSDASLEDAALRAAEASDDWKPDEAPPEAPAGTGEPGGVSGEGEEGSA